MHIWRYGRVSAGYILALASVVFLGVALYGQAARATGFDAAQKTEIEGVIKTYLMQNPEVLRDALTELERRQKAAEAAKQSQAVDDKSADLYNFNAPGSVVIGNPQGKVTLVEFFDYNCGYCKRTLDDVAKLMQTEPELRIVLKDFPVLGPGSVEAAQVAGAVRNQITGDAFWRFHAKLLATHGPVGKTQALAIAKDIGVDMERLSKDVNGQDVKAGIEHTMEVADALSLTGTPSFVIGKEVVVGAVGYDQLKDRIDNVLKCGKAMCS